MSAIAIGMNLLLAGLLSAALAMGWRLNKRLEALRDSHDGFAKAVAELDTAAARAEQGLADLRSATDEATDTLADRIEKARALTTRLDRQLQGAPILAAVPSTPVRPAREAASVETDVERVTHRLGALLSGSREPRPRPEIVLRAENIAPRHTPEFDADLFDLGEPEVLPLRRRAVRGER
jgi:ABC-type transporter Mla subunit MlaD